MSGADTPAKICRDIKANRWSKKGAEQEDANDDDELPDCPHEFHYAAAVVALLPGANRRIRFNFILSSLLIAYLQFSVALLLLYS